MSGRSAEQANRQSGITATQLAAVRRSDARRREARRHGSAIAHEEIERRVRETLYGKSYYHGTHKRVHKELEGHHGT